MIVVSENLKGLIEQTSLVPLTALDEFSITLTLSKDIVRLDVPNGQEVVYGTTVPKECIKEDVLTDALILSPRQAVLACSKELVKMPKGYMGLLQTKGSLARLFVSVHCSDGQVEPGFEGRVTFEICNMGNATVKILNGAPIAQMFIFKTSSNKSAYDGKYCHSQKPTISYQDKNEE